MIILLNYNTETVIMISFIAIKTNYTASRNIIYKTDRFPVAQYRYIRVCWRQNQNWIVPGCQCQEKAFILLLGPPLLPLQSPTNTTHTVTSTDTTPSLKSPPLRNIRAPRDLLAIVLRNQ